MRKALVVLLVTLMVATAAWAQGSGTFAPYSSSDPLLGPHNYNNMGCTACHAPHNAVLQGEGGYLWARAIPLKAYKTYGGGSLNTSTVGYLQYDSVTGGNTFATADDPAAHTVLCLSCHDTVFSGVVMQPANAVVDTDGVSLTNNHPVHVAYPSLPEFWQVTVTNGSASFTDKNGTVFQYGHPGRLYVDSGSNTPYIECGTCHNPHAFQDAVVTQNGTKVAVKTAHFLRGQYDTLANQQNFCVSCHADKSGQWNGTGAQ